MEERDRDALGDEDDGLLPVTCAAGGVTAALGLGLDRRGPDRDDLDLEQLLDRLADLGRVGAVVDAERVLAWLGEHEGLLGYDRADDHLAGLHQSVSFAGALPSAVVSFSDCPSAPAARATSSVRAVSETSSDAAPITSATPASVTGMTARRSRLRNDLPAAASASLSRTSAGAGAPQSASSAPACLVDGVSNAPESKIARDMRSACTDSALRCAARRA